MSEQYRHSTVSVCIVTYNSAEDIEDCLHAVLKQSFPIASIVVVDNNSQDATCELVERFVSRGVKFIRNENNNGFAGGHNLARSYTDSTYVLVLNPDVRLERDYVLALVKFLDKHPEVGSATGQLRLASDPERMDSAGIALRSDHNAYDLAAGEPAARWDQAQEVFGVSGAAAMYRSTMMEQIAYEGQFFDEVFFAYKEDVDVAWRARHYGWKAWYVPAARAVHHRGWKTGGRKSIALFVRRHSYQNRFFVLIKNERRGKHWWKLLPLLLVKEGAKLGYIVLREPGLLACWPFIIKQLPDMWQKRKHMLAGRKSTSPGH
ncbi:glycosyltransferase family 2 protein [Paenibacillus sp. GCM10027626]|uniref:glycosyltransferase family 2 protein n=1 Tax=Paenibacillus sp. GCM10027626 TaxID=3273411 RepID=UPI0036427308